MGCFLPYSFPPACVCRGGCCSIILWVDTPYNSSQLHGVLLTWDVLWQCFLLIPYCLWWDSTSFKLLAPKLPSLLNPFSFVHAVEPQPLYDEWTKNKSRIIIGPKVSFIQRFHLLIGDPLLLWTCDDKNLKTMTNNRMLIEIYVTGFHMSKVGFLFSINFPCCRNNNSTQTQYPSEACSGS